MGFWTSDWGGGLQRTHPRPQRDGELAQRQLASSPSPRPHTTDPPLNMSHIINGALLQVIHELMQTLAAKNRAAPHKTTCIVKCRTSQNPPNSKRIEILGHKRPRRVLLGG
eukprot:954667-Amphidinium_carterae.1